MNNMFFSVKKIIEMVNKIGKGLLDHGSLNQHVSKMCVVLESGESQKNACAIKS